MSLKNNRPCFTCNRCPCACKGGNQQASPSQYTQPPSQYAQPPYPYPNGSQMPIPMYPNYNNIPTPIDGYNHPIPPQPYGGQQPYGAPPQHPYPANGMHGAPGTPNQPPASGGGSAAAIIGIGALIAGAAAVAGAVAAMSTPAECPRKAKQDAKKQATKSAVKGNHIPQPIVNMNQHPNKPPIPPTKSAHPRHGAAGGAPPAYNAPPQQYPPQQYPPQQQYPPPQQYPQEAQGYGAPGDADCLTGDVSLWAGLEKNPKRSVMPMTPVKSGRASSLAAPNTKSPSSSSTKGTDSGEVPVCVICLCDPPQMAFVPCGHVKTCEPCSRGLKSCPYCRHPITEKMRVYV